MDQWDRARIVGQAGRLDPEVTVFGTSTNCTTPSYAVSSLLRLLETYSLRALDFADPSDAADGGSEPAGRPAPLRPKPQLPSLQAEAELPHESVG